MAVIEIFRALGDPARLEMVRRLANGESHSITSISSGLNITRQGARKHLQILADAHLVILESKGRDTDVRLDREALDQGKTFIVDLERQWDIRLNALQNFVEIE